MRSMAANGIWFTSTAPPPMPCAATRLPLSRISVEPEPCPRRFAAESPLLPPRAAPETTSELEARLSAPLPLVDRKLMNCSGLLMLSRDRSSVVMISSGSALSLGSRLMRDPVTIIALPSSSAVSAAAGGGASCATTGAVRQVAINNIAVFVNFMIFPLYGKQPGNFFLSLVRGRGYSRNFTNATRLMQFHAFNCG